MSNALSTFRNAFFYVKSAGDGARLRGVVQGHGPAPAAGLAAARPVPLRSPEPKVCLSAASLLRGAPKRARLSRRAAGLKADA